MQFTYNWVITLEIHCRNTQNQAQQLHKTTDITWKPQCGENQQRGALLAS
jgi:hypothetical protein